MGLKGVGAQIYHFIIYNEKKTESILLLLREFEMNILKCRIFVLIHLNLKRYYDLNMMKISIDILLTQYLLCRYTYFKISCLPFYPYNGIKISLMYSGSVRIIQIINSLSYFF